MASTVGLGNLPDEIIVHILGYLTRLRDLAACAAASSILAVEPLASAAARLASVTLGNLLEAGAPLDVVRAVYAHRGPASIPPDWIVAVVRVGSIDIVEWACAVPEWTLVLRAAAHRDDAGPAPRPYKRTKRAIPSTMPSVCRSNAAGLRCLPGSCRTATQGHRVCIAVSTHRLFDHFSSRSCAHPAPRWTSSSACMITRYCRMTTEPCARHKSSARRWTPTAPMCSNGCARAAVSASRPTIYRMRPILLCAPCARGRRRLPVGCMPTRPTDNATSGAARSL
ncbi:F-box incomplete domain containing protein [Pandoravirus celtis]|uniref:F-box incomplete domain containing protein n=1 Tax=Pandoravirus celtis TaxID=2568002 RepID=A0A4D6EFN4_9VIRU|nr:F-box incomplete domain containing protein [Pandoravirus celtis]